MIRKATRTKSHSASSGFTLVEMLVALAVFMIVAVVAVGALLKITDASRKSQTLEDAVNNVNFALDAITREIRVGSTYDCFDGGNGPFSGTTANETTCSVSDSLPDGTSIAFDSSNAAPDDATKQLVYSYWFAPHPDGVRGHWTIEKAQQTKSINDLQETSYAPIVDPSVVITHYAVTVSESPTVEPSVFIYLSGYSGTTDASKTYFDIQTTVSQRVSQ